MPCEAPALNWFLGSAGISERALGRTEEETCHHCLRFTAYPRLLEEVELFNQWVVFVSAGI